MLYRHALGEILREERLAQGLTLRMVSKQASIALGYLSELEHGYKEASSEILKVVANNGLGLPEHELVMRAGLRMSGVEIPDTAEELVSEYTDLIRQN
jgi:transcriptional regulator with XRE-family HTH domain